MGISGKVTLLDLPVNCLVYLINEKIWRPYMEFPTYKRKHPYQWKVSGEAEGSIIICMEVKTYHANRTQ